MPGPPADAATDRLLAAWAEDDATRALHPTDHAAIRATEAVRSLILELFLAEHARDLFSACARLGSLYAEAGASPSLAAGTIEGATRALDAARAPYDTARVVSARAALFEGFVATVRTLERASAVLSWEYPTCAIRLEDGASAIACGFPLDDREALTAWASRVASRVMKDGIRRVQLAGPSAATSEVADALALVGVAVIPPRKRGWLRLPWA